MMDAEKLTKRIKTSKSGPRASKASKEQILASPTPESHPKSSPKGKQKKLHQRAQREEIVFLSAPSAKNFFLFLARSSQIEKCLEPQKKPEILRNRP